MLKVISFLIILYSQGGLVRTFAIYAQCGINLFLLCEHDYGSLVIMLITIANLLTFVVSSFGVVSFSSWLVFFMVLNL